MASKTPSRSTQQSAPSFTKLLEDVSCQQGQDAVLECCVQGYPCPDIRWEKGGIQLANSRRLHADRQGDRVRLQIKSCTRLETGVFKCIATNKFGSASTTSTVRFDAIPAKSISIRLNESKAASSPDPNKITEFQKNISRLKKVSKPPDGKTNGSTGTSGPSFKEFPLKKSLQTNSTQLPQTDTRPSVTVKKTLNNGSTTESKCREPVENSRTKKEVTSNQAAEKQEKVPSPPKNSAIKTADKKVNGLNSSNLKNGSTPGVEVSKSNLNGHLKTKKEPTPQRISSPAKPTVSKTDESKGKTSISSKGSVRQRRQLPKFILSPKGKVVKEGESVKLMCSGTGVPEPKVTWRKRDLDLNDGQGGVLCYQEDCMHILEITDLKPEDAGDYTVSLTNEVGVTEATALLEVRAAKKVTRSPPRVIRALTDLSVSDGQSCTLSCEISGLPAPTCRWSRDGKVLDRHPDFEESFDGQTASLTIRETFPDDEATYTLTASNDLGKVDTSCVLTLIRNLVSGMDHDGKSPFFTRKLKDVAVNDGDPLTLTVEISGADPTEIVWVHNENVVKNSPDFRYISSEDKKCHSLVIEETFPEDSGIYFCEAYNLYGEDVTACMVTVNLAADSLDTSIDVNKVEKPKPKEPKQVEKLISDARKKTDAELQCTKNAFRRSIVRSGAQTTDRHRSGTSPRSMGDESDGPRDKTDVQSKSFGGGPKLSPAQILKGPRSLAVLRGETITLRCQYVGAPKPTVSWIKRGKILSPSDRVLVEEEEAQAVLTVRGATTDDSGKYVVAVENSGGSDCQFASVSVEGPPDPLAERPVVSDVTNHSLVLAWSGSPFDGGSVITGYAVEMSTYPDLRWQRVSVARHSTSYMVKNLLPNRKYFFRVRAENVHGFSDPSPESEPVFISDEDTHTDEPDVFEDKDVVVQNGNLFSERYEYLEVVGKGRFGVVHRCKNKNSEEVRAAKVIRCVKQKDKLKGREEVDIMNQLRHPKLLQLVAAYENPKELVLVMEFISGGELFERVIADDFVLLEKDCVLFLHQICEGVRYMHDKHVIHLDLKPENILCITKTSHQIKIIDFGLARKFDPNDSIRVLFGTPEFVAPEVIGYEPVSPASDMWSVGVICYVLLTGLSPFMGDNDAETFANITRVEYDFEDEAFEAISEDAKEFINRLFIKRPEKRLSAEGCLKHIWLAKDQNRMSVVQLCTDKLKKFIIRRKWQKTGNAIRAIGRMVSLSSPSRSVSSMSSRSDSELSFTSLPTPTNCSPSITEKDEDNESGVFLTNDCPSIGEVQS